MGGKRIRKPKGLVDDLGRQCNKCEVYKTWENFSKDKTGYAGHVSTCKVCRGVQFKGWKDSNPEAYAAGVTRYVKNNLETVRARSRAKMKEIRENLEVGENARRIKAWQTANKGRFRQLCEAYRSRVGLDKLNERNRRYRRESPEAYAAYDSVKRAKRRNGFVAFGNLTEIKKVYAEAKRLTDETGIPHHVDHVIPLTNTHVQGLHVHQNLQAIPAKENLRKGNRFAAGE